jgi:hypothetical protein
MEQVPDYGRRIARNRALNRFGLAKPRRAFGHPELAVGDLPTRAPDMADQHDDILGSGPPGFALPQVPAPHPRSARARFASAVGAGRVPELSRTHRAGRDEDHAVRA